MKPWSLKFRLLALAALGISCVLVLAGLGFNWLYKRHVETFVLTDLTTHFEQLIADVTLGEDEKISANPKLSDPRFEQPGGGLYWQIDIKGQRPLRSRSLWDEVLIVPTPPDSADEDHAHVVTMPSGGEMFALEKLIVVSSDAGKEKTIIITVGIDRHRVTNPITDFLLAMLWGLAATYAALLATTAAIITLGLRPLVAVKHGIAALRSKSSVFDTDKLPNEILPLAEEINALISARNRQLESARLRASNLAHGLKTPLSVMFALANELQANGQASASDNIMQNASQMRDLVDRELTRSRMAEGLDSHRADLHAVLKRVLTTMKKAPRGSDLNWNAVIPEESHVSMDAVDLMELLGNLLDNARKHARTSIRISHNGKTLTIEDDGPGVSDAQQAQIFKRGVKLDEKTAGSGIGLAIVSDLAEVYGLTLVTRRSDLGGLAVSIELPSI